MKRQNSFTPINYILLGLVLLLSVGLVGLLAIPKEDMTANSSALTKSVPLTTGSFNQPGDIQGAASGLQNAAAVAPSKLDQLQIGR